jgi:CRP-like cAMP-binding protein
MQKTILLIEDNKDVRENTAEILELSNFKVLQANNGKTGVEIATQNKPDLIICDIMMPMLDGYSVIHLLNKNPETATIPFIFLTAKSDRIDYRKGMEMGADDYITKPFDDVELLNAVESRIRKRALLQKEYPKNKEGIQLFFNEVRAHEELKNLSVDKKIKQLKKRDILFTEGNEATYLYFLSKGKIKTYKEHEYGKELITQLYKEGEFIGYIALLEEKSYNETAEAIEDSEIILIPKEDFYTLINANVGVMKTFIKMLSDNIIEKENQLVNIAYSSVRKRTANALTNLYDKYRNSNINVFNISISRDDLANIVGTATESLIRTLSDFKEEKLIEIKGSSITILDIDKLRKLKA